MCSAPISPLTKPASVIIRAPCVFRTLDLIFCFPGGTSRLEQSLVPILRAQVGSHVVCSVASSRFPGFFMFFSWPKGGGKLVDIGRQLGFGFGLWLSL